MAVKCHRYKIAKAEDQTCHLCQEQLETAKHIFCECVAVSGIRQQHFSKLFLRPMEIRNEDPRLISRFIKGLQLM